MFLSLFVPWSSCSRRNFASVYRTQVDVVRRKAQNEATPLINRDMETFRFYDSQYYSRLDQEIQSFRENRILVIFQEFLMTMTCVLDGNVMSKGRIYMHLHIFWLNSFGLL
jgi:hypothetical protein